MGLCGDSTEGLKQRHLKAGAPGGTRGLGLNELSPGGHLRPVEGDGCTPRAVPSAVRVPGQEAVPAALVQAAVGHRHPDHARV